MVVFVTLGASLTLPVDGRLFRPSRSRSAWVDVVCTLRTLRELSSMRLRARASMKARMPLVPTGSTVLVCTNWVLALAVRARVVGAVQVMDLPGGRRRVSSVVASLTTGPKPTMRSSSVS